MMATYFHNNTSDNLAGAGAGDGLHTLILMNPASYVNYSDAPPSAVHPPPPTTANLAYHHHQHPPPSHFVGIPLSAAANSSPQDPPPADGFHPPPRVHYNLYNLPIDPPPATARESTRSLSLTLSSQQHNGGSYISFTSEKDPNLPTTTTTTAVARPLLTGSSPSSASAVNVLLNSKYLKAAQEILDEVVTVGKQEEDQGNPKIEQSKDSTFTPTTDAITTPKSSGDLSTADRHEIQLKKAKLVNMLDEVEQRYRQYHHQMQIVITWFEQAAGIGSARSYTALALKTISKQFRCLKDAILGQIRAANKSLGEDVDGLDGGKLEGSRLKYVDNQIRQQRALQQLGMIQHNAWRPQRGLPERSVSVLRAWLFEHFLHPYPKDSDKVMLAKQTGLTRSQVSNWFINARVRLWKPMVEEMYTEEMKENEKNNNGSLEGKAKMEENLATPTSPSKDPNVNHPDVVKRDSLINPIASNSATGTDQLQSIPGFSLIGSSEIERLTQGSPKKIRHVDILQPTMKFDGDSGRQGGRDEFTLLGAPTNFIGGFGSYPIADLRRFGTGAEQFAPYSGSGAVSLTLGLPHCENMSISGTHQSFLSNQTMQVGRGVELGVTNEFNPINGGANASNVYENIEIERRKRFVAAAQQLLPDFVA